MRLFILSGLFVSATDRPTVGNSEVADRKRRTCSTEQLQTFFFPTRGANNVVHEYPPGAENQLMIGKDVDVELHASFPGVALLLSLLHS